MNGEGGSASLESLGLMGLYRVAGGVGAEAGMCNVSTPPFGITCQSVGFPKILAKFLTVVVELTTPAAFGHD